MKKSILTVFTFSILHLIAFSQTLPLSKVTPSDTINFKIPYSVFLDPSTDEDLTQYSRDAIYEIVGAYFVLREIDNKLKFLLILEHGTYNLLFDIEENKYYLDTETTTQFLKEYRSINEPQAYLQGIFKYAFKDCPSISTKEIMSDQFTEQFIRSLIKAYNLSCGESYAIGPYTENHRKRALLPLPETGELKLRTGTTFEIEFNLNNFLNYPRLQLHHMVIPLEIVHSLTHNDQTFLIEKTEGYYKVMELKVDGPMQLLIQTFGEKIYIRKDDKLVLLQRKERMVNGKLAIIDEYKGLLKVLTANSKTITPSQIDQTPLDVEAISQLVTTYNSENPNSENKQSYSEPTQINTTQTHSKRNTRWTSIPVLIVAINNGLIHENRHKLTLQTIGGDIGFRLPLSYSYADNPRLWYTPEFSLGYQKGWGSTTFEDDQYSQKLEKEASFSIWNLNAGLDIHWVVYQNSPHQFALGGGLRGRYTINNNGETKVFSVNENRTTTEDWSIYNLEKLTIAPNFSLIYLHQRFTLMYSLSHYDYHEAEPKAANQKLNIMEHRLAFGLVF